ncbi:hypothetical protein [Flavobacterium cerinum]|uniref:Uncharacterized protein n=1 Tax=Flavobacterium cerinum TaxID=2502784 RepID=A0A3S3QD41_9FLAO|nr:hypothetical protein [Flavobacterium cerinum]RWX00325.1 hypothetical protein EPI11_08590 [Flavobacterium cerinum]
MTKNSIKESLDLIRNEFINDAIKPNFKSIALKEKCEILYDIAQKELPEDHELLKEVLKTKIALSNK